MATSRQQIILEQRTALGGGKRATLPAPLEQWLDDGAWRNDPPIRRNDSQHKPSAAEVAANLAREAERNGR